MALDKSKPDDFRADNASDQVGRRKTLMNLLRLSWVREDIEEIERVIKDNQEGWAMWRRKDKWREL